MRIKQLIIRFKILRHSSLRLGFLWKFEPENNINLRLTCSSSTFPYQKKPILFPSPLKENCLKSLSPGAPLSQPLRVSFLFLEQSYLSLEQ